MSSSQPRVAIITGASRGIGAVIAKQLAGEGFAVVINYASSAGEATQLDPIFVGKPEPIILENSLAQLGVAADQALMIGDNYHTDIEAGIHAGTDTLLVYTGVSTPEQVAQETIQPTYTVASLDDWDLQKGPRA